MFRKCGQCISISGIPLNRRSRSKCFCIFPLVVLLSNHWTCPPEKFCISYLFLHVSQGNKGGVSTRLSFYGHMLCFLNCHLAAHMRYAKERMDEFEYIMDSQKFDSQSAPRIVDHRWNLKEISKLQSLFLHFLKCVHPRVFVCLFMNCFLLLSSALPHSGWCSGLEILTSEFRTTACTSSAPALIIRTTACCGAKTRSYHTHTHTLFI